MRRTATGAAGRAARRPRAARRAAEAAALCMVKGMRAAMGTEVCGLDRGGECAMHRGGRRCCGIAAASVRALGWHRSHRLRVRAVTVCLQWLGFGNVFWVFLRVLVIFARFSFRSKQNSHNRIPSGEWFPEADLPPPFPSSSSYVLYAVRVRYSRYTVLLFDGLLYIALLRHVRGQRYRTKDAVTTISTPRHATPHLGHLGDQAMAGSGSRLRV